MDFSPVTLFKCLGDETRTRIMLMLTAQGELCVLRTYLGAGATINRRFPAT
ncbi:hypothetical protein PCPL58_p1063 (plasmid) [Pseudomonas cerasi]|nr:hypothetical protein PCPL58_p1063 [Pseudomonas cerasi]